jgi:hypothetical protein
MSYAEKLASIKILWREPDLMTLWGIPYGMREEVHQNPNDLMRGYYKRVDGFYDAMCKATYPKAAYPKDPREDWIYLGSPGWFSHLSPEDIRLIEDWIKTVEVPGYPGEWVKL